MERRAHLTFSFCHSISTLLPDSDQRFCCKLWNPSQEETDLTRTRSSKPIQKWSHRLPQNLGLFVTLKCEQGKRNVMMMMVKNMGFFFFFPFSSPFCFSLSFFRVIERIWKRFKGWVMCIKLVNVEYRSSSFSVSLVSIQIERREVKTKNEFWNGWKNTCIHRFLSSHHLLLYRSSNQIWTTFYEHFIVNLEYFMFSTVSCLVATLSADLNQEKVSKKTNAQKSYRNSPERGCRCPVPPQSNGGFFGFLQKMRFLFSLEVMGHIMTVEKLSEVTNSPMHQMQFLRSRHLVDLWPWPQLCTNSKISRRSKVSCKFNFYQKNSWQFDLSKDVSVTDLWPLVIKLFVFEVEQVTKILTVRNVIFG